MDNNTKFLVLGSEGQLGHELINLLRSTKQNYVALNRQQLDLTNLKNIKQVIKDNNPSLVINCAAYTAVDKAEQEADLAMKINAEAPAAIAQISQEIGNSLIHISTDYVFDGCNNIPYTEEAETNPASVYGQSKLKGEQAVAKYCDQHIIIRTAWVYGVYGKGNFVKTMIRLGMEKETLRIVCDQIGSPTWTGDLAQAILSISSKITSETTGIYHYTNSGVCSWYDLAVATLEEAKQLGFSIQIKNIEPISSNEYPTPAKRPHYSVLSSQKISHILGNYPPHWQKSLCKMLGEYAQENL